MSQQGPAPTMEHFDHDLSSGPAPIPLTILTGFLGAGKTTLLNRLLTGNHDLRMAVLVNDFGAINIDADLVVGVESDVISLANGCVCCQIRDDLVAAVEAVLARPEPIDAIVLEASGVADPAGIAVTFGAPNLRDRLRLDSITCVVDADQVLTPHEHPVLQELKLRQIAWADLLILNKVDLAGAAHVAQVKAWIDGYVSRIRIVETSFCAVPNDILLGGGRFDPTQLEDRSAAGATPHPLTDHGAVFSTWSYESDQPFSLPALRAMVRTLPGTVYRCKGIIYAAEAPQRRAALQVVGRRSDVTLLDGWGGHTPRTRIVAIAAPGGLDAADLQRRFDACTAPAPPTTAAG